MYYRHHIQTMPAYVPGEQVAGAGIVKLNTNENPYPPSPRAMAVLHGFEAERLRRYPHPVAAELRAVAAELHGVPADWVLPGNGSDELLMMLAYAAFDTDRRVAWPAPNFTFYRTLADIQQAEVIEAPYGEDFALPVDALAAAGADVTIVSSPNSPSGTGHATAELDRLARAVDGLVVIDEAYADFAAEDAMTLVGERDNVIVLRTLSKGYSLAGLRVGYAVARPELVAGLLKVKGIYNVGAVPCAAAAEALRDQAYKNECAARVVASRARLAEALAEVGFAVWPSQANFLLCRPPRGRAEHLYESLKARGILIRYFKQPRLADCLRITVGTDAQNTALVRALAETLDADEERTA